MTIPATGLIQVQPAEPTRRSGPAVRIPERAGTLAAATELARAQGSAVVDISRLRTGEFYLAATGRRPFQEIHIPMCLSHLRPARDGVTASP